MSADSAVQAAAAQVLHCSEEFVCRQVADDVPLVVSTTQVVVYVLKGHDFSRSPGFSGAAALKGHDFSRAVNGPK
jgi:hypothetical protein